MSCLVYVVVNIHIGCVFLSLHYSAGANWFGIADNSLLSCCMCGRFVVCSPARQNAHCIAGAQTTDILRIQLRGS
ncbi:hypothetical protein B0H10DRAFT_2078694 [Mycena sp. CBHHK59/15]|nr:hypothetical protein B0H10DRAFT_2078694 [Mycena sp. CBHHK59/15]